MKPIFIILPVVMTTLLLTVFLPRFRQRPDKGNMRLWAITGLIVLFALVLVTIFRQSLL